MHPRAILERNLVCVLCDCNVVELYWCVLIQLRLLRHSMKHILVGGMLVCSLLWCALLHAEENLPVHIFRNLESGKPQTVVVYGTSLTVGGAWAQELKSWFNTQYPNLVTFVNSGGSGQNSDWGVTNLQKKVLDTKPDLIVIEFSYNDAHTKFNLSVEKGAANLGKIISALQTQNKNVSIVLQTMNVPWDPPNGRDPLKNRPNLEAYNDNYRQAAKKYAVSLVDLYPIWKKQQEADAVAYQKMLPDGSHPTAQASKNIAWPPLKTLLEQAQAAAKK
jgi:acyl-CoA thioesterase I